LNDRRLVVGHDPVFVVVGCGGGGGGGGAVFTVTERRQRCLPSGGREKLGPWGVARGGDWTMGVTIGGEKGVESGCDGRPLKTRCSEAADTYYYYYYHAIVAFVCVRGRARDVFVLEIDFVVGGGRSFG